MKNKNSCLLGPRTQRSSSWSTFIQAWTVRGIACLIMALLGTCSYTLWQIYHLKSELVAAQERHTRYQERAVYSENLVKKMRKLQEYTAQLETIEQTTAIHLRCLDFFLHLPGSYTCLSYQLDKTFRCKVRTRLDAISPFLHTAQQQLPELGTLQIAHLEIVSSEAPVQALVTLAGEIQKEESNPQHKK